MMTWDFRAAIIIVTTLLALCSSAALLPKKYPEKEAAKPEYHAYSGLESENYRLVDNALSTNVGNLFSFTPGLVPSGRVKHAVIYVEPFVIVFGGYSVDGSFLDDVQMFDTRSRKWSGVVLRRQCCNDHGQVVETSGLQAFPGHSRETQPWVVEAFSIPITIPFQEGMKNGLQGDLPLPRAEHAGAEANGLAYIFGGVTERYGYSKDFFSFDPVKIQWKVLGRYTGGTPERRAGHSLTTDYSRQGYPPKLYLFGGRSIQSKYLTGLSDVWSYDTGGDSWKCFTCISRQLEPDKSQGSSGNNWGKSINPIGRQHHAAAMANGYLIIYGGIDPVSNTTFNDLWAFSTGLKQWKQLSANSGSTGGYAPPPLYHGSLLSLAKLGQAANSSGFISNDFLLYGGVGGGGGCGAHECGLLETILGQVYRLKITFGTHRGAKVRAPSYSDSVPLGGAGGSAPSNAPDTETMYIIDSGVVFEYARLSGGREEDRGRLLKRYAMESVCFDPQKGLLFEMGGMQAKSGKLATADQNTLSIFANGEAPAAYMDAGENFPEKLWDRSTGEHIRQTNQQPVNGPWTFQDGFTRFQPLLNSSLEFLAAFRIYTVSEKDVVQVYKESVP